LLASAAILAQAADDALSGKWQISMSIGGTDREQSCTFAQKDKELTGTCNTDRGIVQINGKVDEKNVAWKYQPEYNGSPLTVSFKGTMDSATSIKGRVAAEEFGVEGEFTATQSK
jgi:hypothetical protein